MTIKFTKRDKEFQENTLFPQKLLDTVYEAIKNNSYEDGDRLVLGHIIELKINEDKDCIDVHKYVDFDSIEDIDDYDFDSDYLTSFNI